MSATEEEQFDAVIVGAGFSGIHQLIHLRQLGLHCTVIEAGSDIGGTWHRNRYPGARVDTHIPTYELALPELWKEWTWTEGYPGWQEIQAYFAHVAHKLDLRPHCQFDTVVKQAHWDDRLHVWHVTAEREQGLYKISARYLILCIGFASKPLTPVIKGRDMFKGPCCHTSRWPKEGIETTGKRVGIIGTGASGVQVIQEIGPQVAHLTVFQRTPNLALPMRQHSVSDQMQEYFKPVYEDLFNKLPATAFGFLRKQIPRPLSADSEEEREANFEKLWNLGGFSFWVSNYEDVLCDMSSNELAYAFWRKKVSERIKDPKKCTLLAPVEAPHPFGTKRPCLEQRFYEVIDQENVDIVDIQATPILEIYENGVKTAGQKHELDILVFATGFDTHGAYRDIDLRGLNGETIQEHWKDGVTTYLGLTIDNFPNLFFIYGPQGPTGFSNGPVCIQLQSSWVVDTIAHLRKRHITKFMPTTHAALAFKKHVDDLINVTLFSQPEVDGWYMGTNVPGNQRETYNYSGGVAVYKQEIMTEIELGYPNFLMEALPKPGET